MNKKWFDLVPKIVVDLQNTNQLICPNCGEQGIDYLYIGDEHTRVGYMQLWCNKCLKGIYISRALAPQKAKFVIFDTDIKDIVPQYEFVEE